MGNVTIKKASVVVTVPRKDLIEVNETHDGVMFNFKGGAHLYVTDSFLPLSTKSQIKATFDVVKEGNIIFDMNNYQHPASVDIQSKPIKK
jgi:hypothetical protein